MHSLIRRILATATIVAAAMLAPTAASAHAAPATAPSIVTADDHISLTCLQQRVDVSARWYFPSYEAVGLVWLQHGFLRSGANLAGMAKAYADQGLLVVVPTLDSFSTAGCSVANNLADNTPFISTMTDVFAHSTDPKGALAQSLDRAEQRSHVTGVTMPAKMLFSGHSAGGDFVLTAANELRRDHPAAYRRLTGLMLFDPVNSFIGNNFHTAAVELGRAGLPIRVLSSPPSLSNAGGQGARWLQETTRQHFLGAQLTTGLHIDVEGSDTDAIGIASVFGVPRPENVQILRRLAPRWVSDMVIGEKSADYYPGGRYYDMLLRTNQISTLRVG